MLNLVSLQEEQEAARRRQQKDNKDCKSNSTTPTKPKELLKVRPFSLINTAALLFLVTVIMNRMIFMCEHYSRTPVGRRNVPDWWQWSRPLPNPGGPNCCPKDASWTTGSVDAPRKPLWWRRRKTRRTRVLWICCMLRPFLQLPLRVRTHT